MVPALRIADPAIVPTCHDPLPIQPSASTVRVPAVAVVPDPISSTEASSSVISPAASDTGPPICNVPPLTAASVPVSIQVFPGTEMSTLPTEAVPAIETMPPCAQTPPHGTSSSPATSVPPCQTTGRPELPRSPSVSVPVVTLPLRIICPNRERLAASPWPLSTLAPSCRAIVAVLPIPGAAATEPPVTRSRQCVASPQSPAPPTQPNASAVATPALGGALPAPNVPSARYSAVEDCQVGCRGRTTNVAPSYVPARVAVVTMVPLRVSVTVPMPSPVADQLASVAISPSSRIEFPGPNPSRTSPSSAWVLAIATVPPGWLKVTVPELPPSTSRRLPVRIVQVEVTLRIEPPVIVPLLTTLLMLPDMTPLLTPAETPANSVPSFSTVPSM